MARWFAETLGNPLPASNIHHTTEGTMATEMKQCPFCKEPIQAKALVCPKCGRDVYHYKNVPVPSPDDALAPPPAIRWLKIGPFVAAVCVVLFLIYYGIRIYNGW